MKKAKLLNQKKEVLAEFVLPESLYDVPLNRFIDFLVECRPLVQDVDNAKYLQTLIMAVSSFYGIDSKVLLKSASGINEIEKQSVGASLSSLFTYATKLIADFKPSFSSEKRGFKFTYLNEEYTILPILNQSIPGEFILPELSVIEVIEVVELSRVRETTVKTRADPDGKLKRRLNKMLEEKIKSLGSKPQNEDLKAIQDVQDKLYKEEIESRGDPDGSLLYTFYLKTLAILAKKEGEELPFEDSKREIFIQDRAYYFQNINAGIALDADFFLTNILPYLGAEHPAGGFLKNQSFGLVVAMLLKKENNLKKVYSTPSKFSKRLAGVK